MLELRGVTVKYGELTAIRDVFLQISEGDFVALLGANGAGKSTVLSAISGLLPISDGSVVFRGQDTTGLKPNQIVAMGLSMVPEGRHLFPRLSAEENLILGAYTADRAQIRERLERVYGLFPAFLRTRRHDRADRFSGGEQQMIAIARGLMSQPSLLMLDEPSQGLMPILVPRIMAILEEINQHGVTVLLVEQRVREALQVAERGYILQNGQVVLEGQSEELLGNEMVKKAYLGM